LISCSNDKNLLNFRFDGGKFQHAASEQLKQKVNSLAASDSLIYLAKDQGQLEAKSIETSKTVSTVQNQLFMAVGTVKAQLDFTKVEVSPNGQLIAVCDKEKFLQVREGKHID